MKNTPFLLLKNALPFLYYAAIGALLVWFSFHYPSVEDTGMVIPVGL